MFKKILIVTALVAVIGVLVFGAVNRTLAKNSDKNTGQGSDGRSSNEVFSARQVSVPKHQPE